uniref:Lysosomal associated membrane protein family member 5 n=1 Tax=Cyprinus carpio TaxID=7962 RepID=A0A8C1UJM8_CYPCA
LQMELLLLLVSLSVLCVSAEQEVENLSGLSPNPDRDIFVVRENGTTCLMAEFVVKFLIPYDVLALNGIDLITEQASVSIPRGAQIAGRCGSSESELQISWNNHAFTFRIFFSKEKRTLGSDGKAKEAEVWKINKVQLVYNTSEATHFINAYNRESDSFMCVTANVFNLLLLIVLVELFAATSTSLQPFTQIQLFTLHLLHHNFQRLDDCLEMPSL